MRHINVLSIQRISAEERRQIEAIDPAVRLIDAGGWYDGKFARLGQPLPRCATCRRAPRVRAAGRSATASSPKRR